MALVTRRRGQLLTKAGRKKLGLDVLDEAQLRYVPGGFSVRLSLESHNLVQSTERFTYHDWDPDMGRVVPKTRKRKIIDECATMKRGKRLAKKEGLFA